MLKRNNVWNTNVFLNKKGRQKASFFYELRQQIARHIHAFPDGVSVDLYNLAHRSVTIPLLHLCVQGI